MKAPLYRPTDAGMQEMDEYDRYQGLIHAPNQRLTEPPDPVGGPVAE